MKIVSLIVLIFININSCALRRENQPLTGKRFSILQTSTDSNSTVLRIVYPKKLKLRIGIKDDVGKSINYKIIKSAERTYSAFKVDHIKIENLLSTKVYDLSVVSDKRSWSDKRKFRTLSKKSKLKVLVASCMSDTFMDIASDMWPKAMSSGADLNFLIGDNLYADTFSGMYLGSLFEVDERHLWKRHVDHSLRLGINFQKNLTPTLSTWDDHDFGKNDGNKTYKLKNVSQQIFKTFFPQYLNDFLTIGPGVSHKFSISNLDFYFFDNRSFRDETSINGDHLGQQQLDWFQKLKINNKKTSLLINGDQFFGDYHPHESFAGNHPKKFKEFINNLSKDDKKYIFISGDRHLIEVMKIDKKYLGYETHEFTVSGLHSKMYPGALKKNPNSRRIDGFDGRANYGLFTFDIKKRSGLFEAFSSKGKELETKFELD